MKEIRVSPKFVNTRNVRNGTAMIETMAVSAGEGRLAIIHSPAGLGKTRFAQWYASNNRCAFLRCQHNWRTSELEFLQAFCLELGIRTPPHRKGAAFMAVMDELNKQGGLPVFVEEIERLSKAFLELVRDFSDLSLAPFVLVGEEELVETNGAPGRGGHQGSEARGSAGSRWTSPPQDWISISSSSKKTASCS